MERLGVASPTPDFFLFGLPFWNPDYETFHRWWLETLDNPARESKILCLANPNTMNLAVANPAYMAALKQVAIFLNDGVGIRMAARMRGVRTRYNFAGTDLMPRLFAEQPSPITAFFFGATEEANREAARRIEEAHPMLKVVGRVNGYVDPVLEALPLIEASGADVLMCALGQPKQELFMVEHQARLNVKIAVTCGGMFDFFSGTKPRAPVAFRKAGAEWAYRLLIEPRRMFRRYVIGNPLFLSRALAWRARDLQSVREIVRRSAK